MNITGSLQKKNGMYHMTVLIPDEAGKSIQRTKNTGIRADAKDQLEKRKNRSQAQRRLTKWMEELSKIPGSGAERFLLDAVEEWLARKKRSLRLDTYEAYEADYNRHIKPFFGEKRLRLCDVTPRVIQRYVDEKETAGLSPQTVKKHLVILNGVFSEAVKMDELPYNPCSRVTPSKSEKFCGKAYNADEARKLLEAVKGDPVEPAVYLGLYLGLRRSEVAGLRWKDIDFANDIVHICNTRVRYSTVSEQEKTKSRASKRDLYLPSGLKSYLRDLQSAQRNNMELSGNCPGEEAHVCQWPDGRPFQPDYISARFKVFLGQSGLPMIRFHDLRHTAGSLLLSNGQTIKQVQEFLGHEKASTTLDIYTHLSSESRMDTATAIDSILKS